MLPAAYEIVFTKGHTSEHEHVPLLMPVKNVIFLELACVTNAKYLRVKRAGAAEAEAGEGHTEAAASHGRSPPTPGAQSGAHT